MENEDPNIMNGSHLFLLIRMFDLSKGDVLEIGTGYYSTLILHWLATIKKRHVYSYENNEYWYNKIRKKGNGYHHVIFSNDLDNEDFYNKHWGMIFIDNSPANKRPIELNRLKNNADYIVIHDTNPENLKEYGYKNELDDFKYRYDYKKLLPWTTVVSNFFQYQE